MLFLTRIIKILDQNNRFLIVMQLTIPFLYYSIQKQEMYQLYIKYGK